jgi:hypothetical protein
MRYAVSVNSYYEYNPEVIIVESESPIMAMGMAVNLAFGGNSESLRAWVRGVVNEHATIESVKQSFFDGEIGVSSPVEI